MNQQHGPIVFTGLYVAGLLLTITLVVMADRMGDDVLKVLLPVCQIIITSLAIFSAWALQDRKRQDDARDAAEATADAVLAVLTAIDEVVDYILKRAGKVEDASKLYSGNAALIAEELKVLAALPLTALKPADAAVALVRYRRYTRQVAIVLERWAAEDVPRSAEHIERRLRDVKLAERGIYEAIGRPVPDRLRHLVTVRQESEANLHDFNTQEINGD